LNERRIRSGKSKIVPANHPFQKVQDQPKWDDPILGKVWDCSQNLKSKDSCTAVIDNDIDVELRTIADSLPDNCLQTDHCFMIYFRGKPPASLLQGELLTMWNDYLFRIKNQMKLFPKSNEVVSEIQ